MKRSLMVLDTLQIEMPCTRSWERMPGDDSVRHCSACGNDVHDLSTLTAAEAGSLLSGPSTPCVRVHRGADGTVITQDSLAGRAIQTRRLVARFLLTAASWLGLTLTTGCREERRTTLGIPCKVHERTLPEAPPPRLVATPREDGGDLPAHDAVPEVRNERR